MAREKRNPEETKRKLLAAAGEILAGEGLEGFHIHAIAQRAGFGKPLVYRYFGDRRQVLDALAKTKAAEVKSALEATGDGPGNVPPQTYRQVIFARLLAGDTVLRALFRAQLSGALGEAASGDLDKLIPHSGKSDDAGAAEAFLLAGISYILLLKDSAGACAGVPIETPKDLAAFERAFVALSTKNS